MHYSEKKNCQKICIVPQIALAKLDKKSYNLFFSRKSRKEVRPSHMERVLSMFISPLKNLSKPLIGILYIGPVSTIAAFKVKHELDFDLRFIP